MRIILPKYGAYRFDQTLTAARESIGPNPDPANIDHAKRLRVWLNQWICRIGYPRGERDLFAESLAGWWSRAGNDLPPTQKRLAELDDKERPAARPSAASSATPPARSTAFSSQPRALTCPKPLDKHRGIYSTHKHAEVRAWLERNPRITLHFTPTSGSWMNMVEIFFGIITRQAIRRGSFGSVRDLTAAIRRFIDAWNDRCQPFTWTKPADEILPHAIRKGTS